jgi:hypothetical protein
VRRQFSLCVLPRADGSYGVELRQRVNGGPSEGHAVVRAWGQPLYAAMDQVLEALRRSGNRSGDLHRRRKAPLDLKEAWGVRVGLLLLAVKPLRKGSRMEEVAAAIRGMSDEEAYYWFAKCVDRDHGLRAQRAFRDLWSER